MMLLIILNNHCLQTYSYKLHYNPLEIIEFFILQKLNFDDI